MCSDQLAAIPWPFQLVKMTSQGGKLCKGKKKKITRNQNKKDRWNKRRDAGQDKGLNPLNPGNSGTQAIPYLSTAH